MYDTFKADHAALYNSLLALAAKLEALIEMKSGNTFNEQNSKDDAVGFELLMELFTNLLLKENLVYLLEMLKLLGEISSTFLEITYHGLTTVKVTVMLSNLGGLMVIIQNLIHLDLTV
jgi:hypothetical protein